MSRVGRFQVMAALQAARALALGLSLDEAMSWGLNGASFYAAAKQGFRRPRRGAGADTAAPRGARARARPAREAYELGGETAYLAYDASAPLRFAIGDEEQTPEDFEREIVRRFPDWDHAWEEARAIVASAERDDLASQHRFFDNVYKPRRDELAKRWSASAAGS